MHISSLPPNSLEILKRLTAVIGEHHFILGGGTALALQFGHRMSVDLDLFTQQEFSTDPLFQELKKISSAIQVIQEEKGTLTVIIEGVKVSMFHYPYPFLDETVRLEGAPVAGIADVASMKVIAISQRGAKRDFVDLFFILQDMPFWKVADNIMKRFGPERINPIHVGKSLVYFDDAESDPEPKYLIKTPPKWDEIKKFFKRNVQQMVIDLQRAKGSDIIACHSSRFCI